MAMTKPTSEQVTFLQAGTNAVPTTVHLGVGPTAAAAQANAVAAAAGVPASAATVYITPGEGL